MLTKAFRSSFFKHFLYGFIQVHSLIFLRENYEWGSVWQNRRVKAFNSRPRDQISICEKLVVRLRRSGKVTHRWGIEMSDEARLAKGEAKAKAFDFSLVNSEEVSMRSTGSARKSGPTLLIRLIFSVLLSTGVSMSVAPSQGQTHGGGLDSSGGHNCNVGDCAGTYHCHQGCEGGSFEPPLIYAPPSYAYNPRLDNAMQRMASTSFPPASQPQRSQPLRSSTPSSNSESEIPWVWIIGITGSLYFAYASGKKQRP